MREQNENFLNNIYRAGYLETVGRACRHALTKWIVTDTNQEKLAVLHNLSTDPLALSERETGLLPLYIQNLLRDPNPEIPNLIQRSAENVKNQVKKFLNTSESKVCSIF